MLNFDSLSYPFASRRNVTLSGNGMVATSQPLAAQAGLRVLQRGGNAVDAAVATACALTVVEPTSNGIGGDAFAMVWHQGELHGLNGSGPSPKNISIEKVRQQGHEKMPAFGSVPVTVPGAPASWVELNEKFGKLSLTEVMEPAIDYAHKGYPLSPTLARAWEKGFNRYLDMKNRDEFSEWFRVFAPSGSAPRVGEMWNSPDHGRTLARIAESRGEYFYRGEFADILEDCVKQSGGYLTGDDLANFRPEWVDPLKVNYRGYDIWELPPNGQGMVALMALNILKGFNFSPDSKDSTDTYHRQIEALKLAFEDGKKFITDPDYMKMSIDDLLSEEYAELRREQIGQFAATPVAAKPPQSGTVYLAAADNEGNMVSFIQSNYMGFGSGVVVPGTGVALQNRGHSFELDLEHHNSLEPQKRTYHTIIPGFMSQGSNPIGPFGVMGGFMQPQGHLQVVMNAIDFQRNPQACLDAPRWQWKEGLKVDLEKDFSGEIADNLDRQGHQINICLQSGSFGRGQIIWRDPDTGVLFGGTEPRTDGHIACY